MATKTLTDRVSVRVSNKDDSDKSKQKTDSAKNIANALGGSISDDLASEIGDSLGDTYVDENGNEWVPMSDFIAAGKKMYENGAFDEKEEPEWDYYEGSNYQFYRLNSFTVKKRQSDLKGYGQNDTIITGDFVVFQANDAVVNVMKATDAVITRQIDTYDYNANEIESTNTTTADSFYVTTDGSGSVYTLIPNIIFSETTSATTVRQALALGVQPTSHGGGKSGGSLIDWTKSDAEIEEDIRNLHETWDITEHSAAGEDQDLTCCLAGPIEYN